MTGNRWTDPADIPWRFTVAEAVEGSGRSRSVIYRWIAEGLLDTITVGRTQFVTKESWLALFGHDDDQTDDDAIPVEVAP